MKFQLINFKRDKVALLILIAFYIGFGVLATIFQEKIIYHPNKQDFQACTDFSLAEKINHNGTRAYLKHHSSKLVIFYHGNAGSACDRAFMAHVFEQNGYSYLIPEYAGYSNDPIQPSHELLKKDVENMVDFIQERKYTEMIVVGESVGTGFASHHVSLQKPDKLLLFFSFSSVLYIAKTKFWFYPVSFMVKNDFVNTDLLKDFKGEALFIHGDKDTIIPLKLGRRLFDSLGTAHKKIVIVRGAGHNNLFEFSKTYDAIASFLKQ